MARRPLIAGVMGAAALIVLGWTGVTMLVGGGLASEIASTRRQNENLALALEEHTARTLKSVDQLLRFAAFEYLDHPHEVDLKEMAAAVMVDEAVVSLVAIADASGRIIAATRDSPLASVADRGYFRHHRESDDARVLVSAPSDGRLSGRPTIPVSRRISRPDGSFAGVAVAGLNPEYFGSYYGRLDIGESGMLQLVGTDGIARVRHAGAVISMGHDMRGSTLMREQAKRPSGSFLSVGRLEGVPRDIAYRTLGEYGLVVALGTSRDEVLASFRRHHLAYIASGVAFTLLVLLSTAVVVVVTERRRQVRYERLREESRLRATFDEAGVGIAHVGLDGKVLKVNRKLCDLMGYPEDHIVGRGFTEFKFAEDRDAAEQERVNLLATGGTRDVEARYRDRNGDVLWVALSISTVRDPEGKPEYFVAMVQDVTASKAARELVRHQATHDVLTGLPNRALFHDRLTQAINQARRRKSAAAVLFLDLDFFKQVNDVLGHAAGDSLLREVARRLAGSVRSGDTAARIGGDEFAVVLSEIAHPEDAGVVARKILGAMAAPMTLDGRSQPITVSIGIAAYPADGTDVDSLVRSADAAMFQAKRAGRNGFRFASFREPEALAPLPA